MTATICGICLRFLRDMLASDQVMVVRIYPAAGLRGKPASVRSMAITSASDTWLNS